MDDLKAATGKLDWYAQRFKIETYHKVLKSGCRAERAGLRTAERLTNLLAVLCVVAWRVFWLTMTSRATPEAPAEVALTEAEVEILDRLAGDAGPARGSHGVPLPRGGGQAGWLPGAVEGPAAGQHGGLARADPAHGHPPRL